MGKKEKYDLSISHYTKIIKSNPKDYRAYNNRGNAYQKKGHYDLSIADYNKAIELNPRNSMAYTNRGFNYILMGKYEEAESDNEQPCGKTAGYLKAESMLFIVIPAPYNGTG